MSSTTTTPLLANQAKQASYEPSSWAQTTLLALGTARFAFGLAVLVAPVPALGLFSIPVRAEAAFIPRLIGVRDMVLADMVLTADQSLMGRFFSLKKKTGDGQNPSGAGGLGDKREVRRALWANVAADVMEIGVLGAALANGHITRRGFGLGAGGVAAFAILGIEGLLLWK